MDDIEVDPAIAEAMGFTSFGSKRRKHTARADDAFVDDGGNEIPASTGANDIPLGTRPAVNEAQDTTQEHGVTTKAISEFATEKEQEKNTSEGPKAETDDWTPGFPSPQELSALRRGIKNAKGDMVVFMPSFIEDPWKGLA